MNNRIRELIAKISNLESKIRDAGYYVSDLIDHPYTSDKQLKQLIGYALEISDMEQEISDQYAEMT